MEKACPDLKSEYKIFGNYIVSSMLHKFSQFYKLSEVQLAQLWNDAVFVFDTNVLFNFYRYSKETSKEFLRAIQNIRERVWLPYQVGFEFHRSRLSVIDEEVNIYNKFIEKVKAICTEVENKNRNPFISNELNIELIQLTSKIEGEFNLKIIEFEQRIKEDEILKELNDIFLDKLGDEFSCEKLNSIYRDGEIRYKEGIPPGYGDKKKQIPERYGDLVIWQEILEKAKKSSKPIIFITDDGKEDWWLIHAGKTISPRPELLKEFTKNTGQICHFYKPFQFLKYSNTYQGSHIKDEIIEEVKQLVKKSHGINDNIIIKLKLKSLGDRSNFTLFMNSILQDGYQILIESETTDSIYSVLITLPNIVDLERRFTQKYLTALNKYDIELLDYNKYLTSK